MNVVVLASDKRLKLMGIEELVHSNSEDLNIIPVNNIEYLPKDKVIHLLFSKFSDVISQKNNFYENPDDDLKEFFTNVQHHIDSCKIECVVNPLHSLLKTGTRLKELEMLSSCCKSFNSSNPKLYVPEFGMYDFHIQHDSDIILKPLRTCPPDPINHECIVLKKSCSMSNLKQPMIYQNFVSHGSYFLKIYVMGEKVWIIRRSSIQNSNAMSESTFTFNTKLLLKEQSEKFDTNLSAEQEELLKLFSRHIVTTTDLEIFNIDIVGDEMGNYGVIDINLFPSFKDIRGFPDELKAFMKVKLNKQM